MILDFEKARLVALRSDWESMGEVYHSHFPWEKFLVMGKEPGSASLYAALEAQAQQAVREEREREHQKSGEVRYIVVNKHGEEDLLDRDVARTGALVVCAHRDTHSAVDAPHTLKEVRMFPLPTPTPENET